MNRHFYEAMVEHGFDPGGAWDTMDTMHFDYVPGFAKLMETRRDSRPDARLARQGRDVAERSRLALLRGR
ncbi:MAG: M15 family metallopeptidase [Actinobacteria bacterium]|nr:M15 family metallopeptidase [Actinomycetota bacterium]